MLKLLEITGGRRSEVAAISVRSVMDALETSPPMLRIITVKGRGGTTRTRELPVAKHDLVILKEFIEKNRSIVIRKTCGRQRDHGILLVSETTGEPLQPNTITQEIANLARSAQLEDRASPHMFRHRFITKLFVALIEQHRFNNPDAFRAALLSTEDFKRQVLEWTGHRSILSLDTYLHLAFHEMTSEQTTTRLVKARNSLDSFDSSLALVEADLVHGTDPNLAVFRLRELVGALRADISP
jgi:integrase